MNELYSKVWKKNYLAFNVLNCIKYCKRTASGTNARLSKAIILLQNIN